MRNWRRFVGILFGGMLSLTWFPAHRLVAEPPSPDYSLLFRDEFNGNEVNQNIWKFRSGLRWESPQLKENVDVSSGAMDVYFRKEEMDGKKVCTSGGIISVPRFGYGYYETRSKLSDVPGLHSSFWNHGIGGDGVLYPKFGEILEIDCYEVESSRPWEVHMNLHSNVLSKTTEWPRSESIFDMRTMGGTDTSKRWTVHGFEWLPNWVRYYVDGRLVLDMPNTVPAYGPISIWLTALAHGFEPDLVDDKRLPSKSSWDYFRYYARDLKGVNWVGNPDFEYNYASGSDAKSIRDRQHPVVWCEEGNGAASRVVYDPREAYSGGSYLRQQADGAYQVLTCQRLTYIPNAEYSLSAWVRSNGKAQKAEMRAWGYGAEEVSAPVPATPGKAWRQITIPRVSVSNHSLQLGFYSKGGKDAVLDMDDVRLIQLTGKGNADEWKRPTPLLTSGESDNRPVLGEVDVLPRSKGFSTTGEGWKGSGISGAYKTAAVYVKADTQDVSARWALSVPVAGEYTLDIYNTTHPSGTESVIVTALFKGQTKEIKLCQKAESGGSWVGLGTYPFEKGDSVRVTMRPGGEKNGYIRAMAVRMRPAVSAHLSEVGLMSTDSSFIYVRGEKLKFYPSDPDVKSVVIGGEFYAPIPALARVFDATVQPDGDVVTVKAREDGGSFTVNTKTGALTVNGNARSGVTIATLEQGGVILLPLGPTADILGLNHVEYGNGIAVTGSRDLPFKEDDGNGAFLASLFDID